MRDEGGDGFFRHKMESQRGERCASSGTAHGRRSRLLARDRGCGEGVSSAVSEELCRAALVMLDSGPRLWT